MIVAALKDVEVNILEMEFLITETAYAVGHTVMVAEAMASEMGVVVTAMEESLRLIVVMNAAMIDAKNAAKSVVTIDAKNVAKSVVTIDAKNVAKSVVTIDAKNVVKIA